MEKRRLPTGKYFMMGNVACAEGAIAAGCEFAAGYPITPASEVAHTLAKRLPEVGGYFLQTEDEIARIGPNGFSKRRENPHYLILLFEFEAPQRVVHLYDLDRLYKNRGSAL